MARSRTRSESTADVDSRPPSLSLLLVDGDRRHRKALGEALAGEGLHVVAEAADAAGAPVAAAGARADVALVSSSLPGGGPVAVAELVRRFPSLTVVVLSDSPDEHEMLAFLKRGAVGYLPRDLPAGHLARALRAARLGEPAISRALIPALVSEVRAGSRRRADVADAGPELTARERDVAELVREGLDTASIARRLGVSPVTVRRHVSSLLRKLGVPDRAAARRLLRAE